MKRTIYTAAAIAAATFATAAFAGSAGGATVNAVPEPAALAFFGLGAVALVARRRK